jgi:CBS domain-containing protein
MRRVADSMTTPVVVLEPATTIQEASARMLDARVHAAVVVDEGGVCGLLTADQVSGALAEGHDAQDTPIGVIAQPDPPLAGVHEPLAEAHTRMPAGGRLVVVADDQSPVGVLEDAE